MHIIKAAGARLRSHCCWVLVCSTALVPGVSTQVVEQVVVNVNGEILTKRDLEERQIAALAQHLERPIGTADLRVDSSLRKAVDALMPTILAEAVDELLLVQHARELGLDATDEDVKSVLEQIQAKHTLTTEDEVWSFLRMDGVSLSGRRDAVRRKILIEQVRQRAIRGVSVSEPDARQFFAAHRNEFATPPTVTYREIFIPVAPEPPLKADPAAIERRDNALVRFVAARDRVLRGESFDEVAAQYSENAQGAAGATIGPVPLVDLPEPVRAVLSRLRPREVSMPVKTQDGYRLLKLEALVPARSPSFEQIREAVIDRASSDLRLRAMSNYMTRLREGAIIYWKNRGLQDLYERSRQRP